MIIKLVGAYMSDLFVNLVYLFFLPSLPCLPCFWFTLCPNVMMVGGWRTVGGLVDVFAVRISNIVSWEDVCGWE